MDKIYAVFFHKLCVKGFSSCPNFSYVFDYQFSPEMHGSFIVGLRDMITSRFDDGFWIETLEEAGLEPIFRPAFNQEVDDSTALKLIKSAIKRLNLDDRSFGEIYGNFWINTYARDNYFAFFNAYKTVKDFLNHIHTIHQKTTSNLKNPKPPEFSIYWESPSVALIKYKSERGLIHIAVGMLKALGNYYREELSVYRVNADQIKIFFRHSETDFLS